MSSCGRVGQGQTQCGRIKSCARESVNRTITSCSRITQNAKSAEFKRPAMLLHQSDKSQPSV